MSDHITSLLFSWSFCLEGTFCLLEWKKKSRIKKSNKAPAKPQGEVGDMSKETVWNNKRAKLTWCVWMLVRFFHACVSQLSGSSVHIGEAGRLQILCGIANRVASSLSYPIKVIPTDWKWWPWPFPLLALAEERGPRTTVASNQGWRVTQLHASCRAKQGLCPWMMKTKKNKGHFWDLCLFTPSGSSSYFIICVLFPNELCSTD